MNSTLSGSKPNLREELFASLVRDMDHAENPALLLEDFCVQHPDQAEEARRYAYFALAIDQSKPSSSREHPKQLGDFRIIRQMARGGMGVIYEAIQERLKRRVVLKTMNAGWSTCPSRLRFNREQEVLARLHQTHIVPIHTADEKDGLQYFVMPYIEGASLNHVIEEFRTRETTEDSTSSSLSSLAADWMVKSSNSEEQKADRPIAEVTQQSKQTPSTNAINPRSLPMQYYRSVAQTLADVAGGLHHAHLEGLLHRDMKPSNIMIEPHGKCWIIDFGLAGFLNQPESLAQTPNEDEFVTEPLTKSHLIGTPVYMAPEQWQHKADVRTDVWGLGVTLYELLTLHRPFELPAESDSTFHKSQIREMIEIDSPIPPAQHVPNVPADLAAICLKALEKDPANRYATAEAFRDDLDQWLRGEPVSVRPAGLIRKIFLWINKNRAWATTLVSLAMVMIAIPSAIAILQQQRSDELEQQSYVQKLMHYRFVNRQVGWSEEVKQLARLAVKNGKTQQLTDEYAATLGCLDATMVKRFQGFSASGVAFDTAGHRLLIGGSESEAAKVWHTQNDEVFRSELKGHGPVAFAVNGTPLQLTRSPKQASALWLWDISKQQLVREFSWTKLNNSRNLVFALSSNGSYAAVAQSSVDRGVIYLWDTASGEPVLTINNLATSLSISPDGKFLAVGTQKGVEVWSTERKALHANLVSINGMHVLSIAFGRDPCRIGNQWLLAVGDAGSLITIWRLEQQQQITFCRGSQYEIHSLSFSPDGSLLASAGRNSAKIWNVATGQVLLDLADRNTMLGVAFSSQGDQLAVSSVQAWGGASSSDRGGVDIWKLHSNRGIQTLSGMTGAVGRVFFSPDDKLVVALSHAWQIGLWEVATGKLKYILDAPRGYWLDNFALSFNKECTQCVMSAGEEARLYDVESGKLLTSWKLPPGLMDNLAFQSTDKLMSIRFENEAGTIPASRGQQLIYRIRNLLGNQPLDPLHQNRDFNHSVFDAKMTQDGGMYFVNGLSSGPAGLEGKIKAYQVNTGKEIWSVPFKYPETYGSTDIDPTEKLIACFTNSRDSAALLDIATGKHLGDWSLSDFNRMFVSQKYWVRYPPGTLIHGESSAPLVNFVQIGEPRYTNFALNSSQSKLIWGNQDGTVMLVDIPRMQRSLAEVGLGW
ncbi:MAG: protein kinase [Planctomycetia bacterium]|nr:protein kinase [Planctomycetia bacterium]